jgi:C4-dicarboxylate transporter DctM subunit
VDFDRDFVSPMRERRFHAQMRPEAAHMTDTRLQHSLTRGDERHVVRPRVLLQSANMSAMLLYIITNAVLFSFLMTYENIPQAMAAWITDTGVSWVMFLLFVNLLLLLAGNVMEPSSIVLIMAPILFPVAVKLGIDPVHFGVLIVVNMEVGMCHPPVGLNLYVASGITKMGITELTIAVWPWLLTMLVFLGLVTYWPDLSLWLPRALGML